MPFVNICALEPCGLCKHPAEYSEVDGFNKDDLSLVQCSNGRCRNASWGTREWNRNQQRIEMLRRLYTSLAAQVLSMESRISEAPRKSPLFVTSTVPGAEPGPCPLCSAEGDCAHRTWIDNMIEQGK